MRILVIFAPAFIEWPLAIAQEIQKQVPNASFAGIATSAREIYDRVAAHATPHFKPVYYLGDLEQQWIDTEYDADKLQTWEQTFEPGFLHKIVVADRVIGNSYVSGGILPPCPLLAVSSEGEKVRRYVYGLLQFFDQLIHQEQVDAVFCYAVAGAWSVALRELCRLNDVIFMNLSHTRIGTRNILDDASKPLLAPVARLFEEALQNPEVVKDSIPQAEKYIQDFRSRPLYPQYVEFSQGETRRAKSWAGIASQLGKDLYGLASALIKGHKPDPHKPKEWQLALYNLSLGLRIRRLARHHVFDSVDQIAGKPFAYYPLHVDPEASTMVLSPMHVNQLQCIEALSKSIPFTWNLVVKEHAPMIGKRPPGFYETLRRFPNVILLPPDADNFSLIRNAHLTCTITGTAGWESILLKRPTLVIGDTPYLVLKQGFVHGSDLSDLPKAILQACHQNPIEDERLILYLAAMFHLSFDFPTELLWGKITRQTIEENLDILNELTDHILESYHQQKQKAGHPETKPDECESR